MSETQEKDELISEDTIMKGCPFCGGKEIWITFMLYEVTYMANCQNCGCTGPRIPTKLFRLSMNEGQKEAIKQWNNRINNGYY